MISFVRWETLGNGLFRNGGTMVLVPRDLCRLFKRSLINRMEYSGQYSFDAMGFQAERKGVYDPVSLLWSIISGSIDLFPQKDRPGRDCTAKAILSE
jgi:hypothetical protein